MKRQNGITLIALVITIIVLLILAGVSISMISGDDGIISRAGEARTETKAADIKEQIELIAANNKLEKYAGGDIATVEEVATALYEKGTITAEQKTEIINTKKLVLESETIDFEIIESIVEAEPTGEVIQENDLVQIMTLTNGTDPEMYLIDYGYYPIAVSGMLDDTTITGMTFYIKEKDAADSTYQLASVRHPVAGDTMPGPVINNPVIGDFGSAYTFVAFNIPDSSKIYTLKVEFKGADGGVRYAEVDTPSDLPN